jgi:hypothetical protein
VGAAKLSSDLTLNWGGIEGFRIAGKQGIGIIAACQVLGGDAVGGAGCAVRGAGWGRSGCGRSCLMQAGSQGLGAKPRPRATTVLHPLPPKAVLMGGPEYAHYVGIKPDP